MKKETFDRVSKGFSGLRSYIEDVYDYNGANYILEKYAFGLPVVSKTKYNEFAEVFCKLAYKSDKISFYSLWIMTARRGGFNPTSDRDLFDDIPHRSNNIDKESLSNLIETMGNTVKQNHFVSGKFLDNFNQFISGKVNAYFFNSKDIANIRKVLEKEYPNNRVSETFIAISEKIASIDKNKKNADISMLNDWAYKHNLKNDDLVKQLSYRSTYINLLYERLVKENNIKDINPQEYYLQHRIKVQKKVKDITGTKDSNGREIVRKYAINKVYKAIGSQDKFKHNSIFRALVLHKDEPFYADTVNILTALDGGEKNREVKKPIRLAAYNRI